MNANSQGKTRRLAGLALFTALIVILQLLGSFIRFGPVSVSLVALPIAVGAAVYGGAAGLWLGFVFGMVVLLSGDAAAFFAFSVPGTLLTVLVKGIACGGLAGFVYAWLAQKNRTLAAVAAAIVCHGVFVGAGDTRVPCIMNLISMWAVRLTLAAWLAPQYGITGVWIAMALELCFRGLLFLGRLASGAWRRGKALTRSRG